MGNKKPFNNRYNKKQEDDQPKVWKSSPAGKKFADWQQKLRAISICISNKGTIDNDEVERIYQDLIHRG